MNFLEKDIEDVIYNACVNDYFTLYDHGLSLEILCQNPVVLRQFYLGGYGVMDIVLIAYNHYTKSYHVNVLELKKDKVDLKTLEQGIRYRKGVEHYFRHFYPGASVSIKITLIGREIEKYSSLLYTADYFPGLSFYTYSLDLVGGLRFTNHAGYQLTEPDFQKMNLDVKNQIKKHVFTQIREDLNV